MLVFQKNCGKEYECIIFGLEVGLGLKASIVCIQEPFLGNQSLVYAEFYLYWPSKTDNQKDMQVLIAVKKYILNKVIIENRTYLISHPYCIVLDIKELNPVSGKFLRKTKIVNLYDNKVGNGCVWQGSSSTIQWAIQYIP